MVVCMGSGLVGKVNTTHHSNHAVFELANDIFVQHRLHSQVIPYFHAALTKASTAFLDPMDRVHPRSMIT